MVSLVLTIIAFAGAMGVPAFLTAIVESAFKIRPSSSRTKPQGGSWCSVSLSPLTHHSSRATDCACSPAFGFKEMAPSRTAH